MNLRLICQADQVQAKSIYKNYVISLIHLPSFPSFHSPSLPPLHLRSPRLSKMVKIEISVVTSVFLSLVAVSAHSDRGRAAYDRHLAREHEHLRLRDVLASTTNAPTGTVVLPTAPPLSQISGGMPTTEALYPLFTTFPAGASPPIANAPHLPSENSVPRSE